MRSFPAAVFTAALLSGNVATADPFAVNGAFATEGVFTCLGSLACAGSGTNSITLGSGSNTATLTFNGVDTTVTIRNVATPVSLGEFETSSSPGFTFPTRTNPNSAILAFTFTIRHTAPVEDTNRFSWRFGPGRRTYLPLQMGQSYTAVPLHSTAPGQHYPMFLYSFSPFPVRIAGSGLTDLTANVGAVPEPGTMLLVGGGLAAAIAYRRKRRVAEVC